jgi:fluoride exporter
VSASQPDSHGELPLDPDTPVHLRPSAWAWVLAGGVVGTGLRWAIEQAVPTSPRGWPWATFGINLTGAFVLGLLLEFLARSGSDTGWRRRARLFGGTGLCGAFTTYSTLALEITSLGRDGVPWWGLAYGVSSVALGVLAAWAGIAAAGAWRRRTEAPS